MRVALGGRSTQLQKENRGKNVEKPEGKQYERGGGRRKLKVGGKVERINDGGKA